MRPSSVRRNCPLREKCTEPSVPTSRKKPLPLVMATSSERPLASILPCLNDCTTALTVVPRPILLPAYTSANCVVDCL
ncbi:hypothetical protein D3C72_1880440 [compost metagenome]